MAEQKSEHFMGSGVSSSIYSNEGLVSSCGIAVGESKHVAVKGEGEIKRLCQEQPPLTKMLRLMLPDLTFILSHSCMPMYSHCSI